MTSWITICDTCRRDERTEDTQAGTSDGERFAEMIEAAAQGVSTVATRRHACLMGCSRSCNVAIQAEGKLNYTLGEFEPSEEAAAAVVEYARKHSESESGQVPYREWPQPIKGHFVTRHPPLPTSN